MSNHIEEVALLAEKAEKLRSILCGYSRVAVAFSGGVDSSLVLKCALDALGNTNVLVLHARSCLQKSGETDQAMAWLARHGFNNEVARQIVDLQPLSWREFVRNPADRCYLCKSKVFSLLLDQAAKWGVQTLMDGTNKDDMHDTRPGLRAINELGIKTPLVDAGFTKEDVRQLSRKLHLDTWNRPSSSCMATRIPSGLEITTRRLEQIALWENRLAALGFDGCRARMDRLREDTVYLEFQAEDISRIVVESQRMDLIHFFNHHGVKKIYLDLGGR